MTFSITRSRTVQLIALVTLFMVVGAGIGMITNAGKEEWYDALVKSSLNPPGWVFGAVWSTLYLMMAVSFWCLLGKRNAPGFARARNLFIIQTIVNWGWSFAFFTFHLIFVSFAWILVMIVLVAATIKSMWRVTRPGAILLLPYFMWICFASYLAGTIWWLNP